MVVKSKTSPRIAVRTLLGDKVLEWDASSFILKTCSVGQMSKLRNPITKIAPAHANQMRMLRASFSLHA